MVVFSTHLVCGEQRSDNSSENSENQDSEEEADGSKKNEEDDDDDDDISDDDEDQVEIVVGPFVDKQGNGVSGIRIFFHNHGEDYLKFTDKDGIAIFKLLPDTELDEGTEFVFSKNKYSISFEWPLERQEYDKFINDFTRINIQNKEDTEEEPGFLSSNWWLFLVIIILVVLIIIFAILLIVRSQRKSNKQTPSSPPTQNIRANIRPDHMEPVPGPISDKVQDRTEKLSSQVKMSEKFKKQFAMSSLERDAPLAPENVKDIIPGYQLTHKLGSGGFASVYSGIDPNGAMVAVKLPKFMDSTVDMSVLEKFETESNMWKKLDHKNIVGFYQSGIQPIPYMVLELMEGSDLKQVLKRYRFSVKESIGVIYQILDAMAYAHRMASVHRDIKPENILFTREGVPKVTDWGIGKFMASEGVSKTIGTKGTLAYGSPEQISTKKYGTIDWQTDVFQLGIVFYEILTGVNPFHDDDPLGIINKITNVDPVPPSQFNSEVPSFLDSIVLKALKKQKAQRWSSAEEMFSRLKMYRGNRVENLKKYEMALKKAMNDGKVSAEEENLLSVLRKHLDISVKDHKCIYRHLKNSR